MGTAPQHDVTRLLLARRKGDTDALERLTSLVDKELRRLDYESMRREKNRHLLQATALVNQLHLRLIAPKPIFWQNRSHFFSLAARRAEGRGRRPGQLRRHEREAELCGREAANA